MRFSVLLSAFAAWAANAPAPSTQLDCPYPPERQLAPAANRLGVSQDRLLKARIALRHATQDIDIITSHSLASLSPLLPLWAEIDPENAPAAHLFLLQQVRSDADLAESGPVYDWCALLGADLLNRLADHDYDLALGLAREWPPPGQDLPLKSQLRYAYLEAKIVEQRLQELARVDPIEALRIVDLQDLPLSYQVRGLAAQTLHQAGDPEQAEAAIRSALQRFDDSTCDSEVFLDYGLLLHTLAPWSTDLFLEAKKCRDTPPDRPRCGSSLESAMNRSSKEGIVISRSSCNSCLLAL